MLVPSDLLLSLQSLMLKCFYKAKPQEALLCSTLAELVTILTKEESAPGDILSELLTNLIETFNEHTLATQLALLCLLNKCYFHCETPLRGGEIENTFRILKRLFDACSQHLEEKPESNHVNTILNDVCFILNTIIKKQHIDGWGNALKKERIPEALILVVSIGITVSQILIIFKDAYNV